MSSSVAEYDGLVAVGVRPVLGDDSASRVTAMLEELGDLDGVGGCDADRVDVLGSLEALKGAAAAAQARVTKGFESSQLAAQGARGVRAKDRGRGIGDQVALARGDAASQGWRHLGFAKAVVDEMPHTHALLTAGQVSEWTATQLVKETAILTVEDRRLVDERLCAMRVDTTTGQIVAPVVVGLTSNQAAGRARALACELDPQAAADRAAKAKKDRRVTIRPAPETMTYVTGLVPVDQGVACWANLDRSARALKAGGDPRSLNQLRSDLFVERLTGQASADAVPVEVELVMDPDTLIGASDRPARAHGGPTGGCVVPAATARDWVWRGDAPRWLRRVFTDPVTGQVTDLDARRRRFHSAPDARFTRLRDQHCRHPRCEGGIGHLDHPKPVAQGGLSTRANSQGLCEPHNYVKEMPGWSASVVDDRPGHHTIEVTTPTGHTYQSKAPPGLPPPL